MDEPTRDFPENEADVPRVEVVEVTPGAPWEWAEVRPVRPRRRWRAPLALFLATCASTWYVGTVMADGGHTWWGQILAGLRYALPVMTILVCHEMGHFLQAHRYRVQASWPYFIPVPLPPFGTFGAVIAMEPRVGGRRAIFDIGISGPLAGLVPTFIFLVIGLHHSTFVKPTDGTIIFGDPLLFSWLAEWICGPAPKGTGLALDPMAFAGWVGLFITSLNLIPIGQLDGGHVLYALLRDKAHRVASSLLFFALFMVVWKWEYLRSWTLMLILLFLMGPIHPPTANDEEPLGPWRVLLGWLTLAFIIVGFTPIPILEMS